jgi:hypothetical protein
MDFKTEKLTDGMIAARLRTIEDVLRLYEKIRDNALINDQEEIVTAAICHLWLSIRENGDIIRMAHIHNERVYDFLDKMTDDYVKYVDGEIKRIDAELKSAKEQ